ncbi:hypothetical protein GE061_001135 [Apolygus lucorum]|uniref:Zinc finger protein-like 1 homolog n=1 Tax=Apolygus lucorum TaxID=248454 RepID=A0A6A4K0Z5_APOLU|nr:hypothetical protein GE061_001135 [Apolygus lucorum]
MGLCKCPKKVVTTLFCYEHRVNVCQRCLATNHPQCVVQSYLEWLKDSDYDPTCKFCAKPFANKECLRLICLHLYHWDCLDEYCSTFPSTTAPAGYTCLHCDSSIFPPPNASSLIADYCREKLASVNWGRNGLGLPLLSQDGVDSADHEYKYKNPNMSELAPLLSPNSSSRSNTLILFEDDQIHSRGADSQIPRRVHPSLENALSMDADDDKYARRSAAQPLSWIKWLQRRVTSRRCTFTRVLVFLFCFIIISILFLTIDMTYIPE